MSRSSFRFLLRWTSTTTTASSAGGSADCTARSRNAGEAGPGPSRPSPARSPPPSSTWRTRCCVGPAPKELAEVALLAYWPDDRNASDSAVIRQTLACLRAVGAGGTPTRAGFAIAQVNAFAGDGEWMQTLREHPVTRTRRGERTHPRRNENQPPELAIADPAATRSLRPPRMLRSARQPRDMDQPGFRLHPLRGEYQGHWSVDVSGSWRIVFRFEAGETMDVDLGGGIHDATNTSAVPARVSPPDGGAGPLGARDSRARPRVRVLGPDPPQLGPPSRSR